MCLEKGLVREGGSGVVRAGKIPSLIEARKQGYRGQRVDGTCAGIEPLGGVSCGFS